MRYTRNGEARKAGAVGHPGFGSGRIGGGAVWGGLWRTGRGWLGGKFGDGRFGGRNQRGGFPGSRFGGPGWVSRVLGLAGYGWAPDYGCGIRRLSGLYEESWFPRQYGNDGQAPGGLTVDARAATAIAASGTGASGDADISLGGNRRQSTGDLLDRVPRRSGPPCGRGLGTRQRRAIHGSERGRRPSGAGGYRLRGYGPAERGATTEPAPARLYGFAIVPGV